MLYRLCLQLLAACICCYASASPPDPNATAAPDKPLFTDHAVLELSLEVDFDALCRPNREPDCDYTSAVLGYTDPGGEVRAIPVELKVRGGWRARRDHCEVPPLFVRFTKEGLQETPFAGQSLLPLTTHCRNSRTRGGQARGSDYEQYVLREYLGYRLYNLLTPQSLRVRLARIRYTIGDDTFDRYAFFTEHFDDMAERNRGQRLSHGSFDHEDIDLAALDRVSLFNFMIGNTDTSVPRERNIVLIAPVSGPTFPVPYDLDMSGLVDAEYGGVSPRLDFRDPRQRYYLGFCHPQENYEALFALFSAQEQASLALVDDIPGFNRTSRKTSRRYLKDFFGVLDSPDERREVIIEACHPWPPSPVDHTTPPETAQ